MAKETGKTGTKRVRTCIACGAQGDKVGLLRIVRDGEGQVRFDATGRAAGRGAYVCSPECFAAATKAKRLSRALKTQVKEEDYTRIANELRMLAMRA